LPELDLNGIHDLRDWLEAIGSINALQSVEGAHWDEEIGAISELNYRRTSPAAMLFDAVPGYPRGFRVLTGSVSDARRTAITLRLGSDLDDAGLVNALRGKPTEWEAAAKSFGPATVDSAPVLKNVQRGDEIDLYQFPVPKWHDRDGGRYIGTGCMVVTSDPDTGELNGGSYRMQVQDNGRSATVNAVPGKHGAQHIAKWFAREGRAPVAITLGDDPIFLMVGGTEVPTGVSEFSYAGAILGRPIEVITGPETGLPIPASSEIAIEGWLTPDNVRPEGPFGEWTGYYSGSQDPVLNLDIAAVYHRDDPILLGAPPGKPPHDYSYMRTVLKSAMVFDALVKAGVPGVKGVWAHESGGGRLLITVSISQRYCGHSRQAAYIAAQAQAAAYMNRYVIVVDDDVDPTNLDEVMWAVSTRSEPAEDIEIMRKTWGSKVDPLLKDHTAPYNSRAIIDACIPFERRGEFPAVAVTPLDKLAAVRTKWAHVFDDPRFPLTGFGAADGTPQQDDGAVVATTMSDS
jgi:UbiD family decarboxylase